MKEKGSTCVNPSQNSAKQNRWIKETPGSWFSEYSKGFQIDYNVTDPQFKFLRLLSSRATQQFVYECSSSVGWFNDVSGNYDKSVHLKAHNDDIIGYSPDETRFEVEDSCHVSIRPFSPTLWRPTEYNIFFSLVIRTDELQSSSIQERLTFSQSRISELLTLATR